MKKTAATSYPIHQLLADRWSPLAFSDRAVETDKLGSLLEAARWSPSSFNEQPWAFLTATKEDGDGFERLASCLVAGNSWARRAPVLMLSVAQLKFSRNGRDNRHAFHDVGLAVGSLMVQAQALGLSLHQMGGFDVERARETLAIPEGFEPVAMIAIGYRDELGALPEAMQEREAAPRTRKEAALIHFGAAWGEPLLALRSDA